MVSILILAYNNFKYTKQCIESILAHTSLVRTPFEIIVVDNASNDETIPYLQGLQKSKLIRVIYNRQNMGFPAGNNQGAKIAKGEYLLLLNNDTIVTEGWLENLLRCIRSDSKLAAVGPYTNHSSGYQQVEPQPTYRGDQELQDYAKRFSKEEKYVDFLVFFCCLIKRSVWNEIGGLDEDFGRGLFEDNMFCWQMKEKGYKMKVCNAYIHHYTSKTFGCFDNAKQKKEYATLMAKNQKMFLKKINRYETISLCMICSDREQPKTLKRCLDTVAQWVDELCIVFNYKHFKQPWRKDRLWKVAEDSGTPKVMANYFKWTDFSHMRNKSLDMAAGQWVLWMDVDDILMHPMGLRDIILTQPKADAFRFKLLSATEIGTQEIIFHTNLFRNRKDIRFTGRVHEDINPDINRLKLNRQTTNLTIQHLGYMNLKTWKRKNLRNYKLLLMDLKDKPTSLIYYHIVNCLLIIGGEKNMVQAIKYIDECIYGLKLKDTDPLLPKMWVLRGIACMDANQMLAAKQSFHKAYDEWKHIEGAVNLGEIYMREKNWDKVIEILTPIYDLKEFPITNIPMDTVQAECMMLEKLGMAYHHKAENTRDEKEIVEFIRKAEHHYREYLSIRSKLLVVDRLSIILRQTNRMEEAAGLTVKAVNQFPGYWTGWFNLAQFELANKRANTARLFLEETLRLKPDNKEARHNLKMIKRGGYVRSRGS